jgi:hypothetical protein
MACPPEVRDLVSLRVTCRYWRSAFHHYRFHP